MFPPPPLAVDIHPERGSSQVLRVALAALLGVAAVSLAVLTATITPPPPSEGVPVRQSKVYESEEQYLARKRNEYKDKFEKADLERQEDSVRLRQQSTLTKEEATAKPPAPQPETVEI